MINGNGRPASKRKQVQFLVALTLLAWATQTLHRQWAFGTEANDVSLAPDAPRAIAIPATSTGSGDADDAVSSDKFLPATNGLAPTGTLEMRTDATITGNELKLRQLCRWSAADEAAFAPVADFVVDHFKPGERRRAISMDQLRSTLQDARVNLGAINFGGAAMCKVARSDVDNDQHADLNDWIAARQPTAIPASAILPPNAVFTVAPAGMAVDPKQFKTLREKLIDDVATRLKLSADTLQMTFRPQDEKVLGLSEPQFRFDIEPVRVRNLGDVSWQVIVLADNQSQRVQIEAEARAWQNQLVIVRGVAPRQVIRDDDCVERRTLADKLSDDPLLTRTQLVNQQAAQELNPGMVMTARMVEAVPMVRAGEFVTVTLTQGSVQIKTVARAMESGAYGQSIRVKNETTRDVYQATMTGPQAASMESDTLPK